MFSTYAWVPSIALTSVLLLASDFAFANPTGASDLDETSHSTDPDQPLLLTPYLEQGDINTARSLSRVGKLPFASQVTQTPSYSGFFTVDKNHDSNMFFWFIPAQNNDVKAPIIFWLEGGPGTSGLYGVFDLHGPYKVTKNITLEPRPHTWTKEFHVIYIDNPVGTGYSYANPEGYSVDEKQVSENLYEFLQQFFKLYYEYVSNDLYVVGDSYAGNYVPYIALKLHLAGPPAQITFKGIAIASGIFEVETQMNLSEFYYQLGIVDSKQKAVIHNSYEKSLAYIREGNFKEALYHFDDFFHYYTRSINTSHLHRFAGYTYYENFLHTNKPVDQSYFHNYVVLPEFKKALHVGNLTYDSPTEMVFALFPNIIISKRDQLITIMNNYKVVLFNGQMDLYTPYITFLEFLMSLEWELKDEFRNCDRRVWTLDGKEEVAGYIHHVGDFYSVLVRSAGHRPTYEQPENILDLISRFIKGTL